MNTNYDTLDLELLAIDDSYDEYDFIFDAEDAAIDAKLYIESFAETRKRHEEAFMDAM